MGGTPSEGLDPSITVESPSVFVRISTGPKTLTDRRQVPRRERVAVFAAAALIALPVLAGVLTTPTSVKPRSAITECPGGLTPGQAPTLLTPSHPLVLRRCEYLRSPFLGISFTLTAPADLRGAWASDAPEAVGIFGAPLGSNFDWPCPGCYALNGTFNQTLFPGAYEILAFGSARTLVATQNISAVFDRGLVTVAALSTENLSAGGYQAWPVTLPPGSSDYYLHGLVTTTGCSETMAVLPAVVFARFQTDRSEIWSPLGLLLGADAASTCPTPPVANPLGVDAGPITIQTGEELVFYNSWPGPVEFSVADPIQISFLT